jgi:predicted PurR-regulated permease PerM
MSDGDNTEETEGDPTESLLERLLYDAEIMRGALLIVAAGIVVAFLYFARVILVPIVLAAFLSYVLNPLVEQLSKLRVPATQLRLPRIVSVGLVVLFSTILTGALGFVLGNQMRQLGAELPKYSKRIAKDINQIRTEVLELEDRVQKSFEPIRVNPEGSESGMEEPDLPPGEGPKLKNPLGRTDEQRRPREIVVRPGGSNLWQRISPFLAGGLSGLLGYAVQGITLMFVLFFTLLQAPNFKDKLLNIVGTTDRRRRVTLQALEDINRDVQSYLFGRALINVVLATAIAIAFLIYGIRYALLLGILGGLLNFIPYFGAVVGMGIAAAVAYMQFGTPSTVLTTITIYFVLTSIEGNLITPIALGRQLQLNSLAVLLGLIFWGWLWGAIGMLLAIPILAVARVVSEHVPDLDPVAELLRE